MRDGGERARAGTNLRFVLRGPKNPKLESALLGSVRARAHVVVEAQPSRVREAEAALRSDGGSIVRVYGRSIEAVVPRSRLAALAASRSVHYVRAPRVYADDAISGEEIQATGAAAWQAAGLTGAGVKVAVIDSGFKGLPDRIAEGELPSNAVTVNYCGGEYYTATQHGAAVAEIVHEMAPDSQLYLICTNSDVGMSAAVSYVENQGVAVVNQSRNGYFGRGDGTGPEAQLVTDARAHGILWVNSAGNYTHEHWSGTFTSADGDQWLDFAPGHEINGTDLAGGATVCATLRWDSWPATAQDYDLTIFDLSFGINVVAQSTNAQTGTQSPFERACYTNPSSSKRRVGVSIWNARTTASPRLDLLVHSGDSSISLDFQNAADSLGMPADSPNALTVGAMCWQASSIEDYSSQGPTLDGRVKPDLTGPDAVSGATYGVANGCSGGFHGTSASSPGVAGAAALVKQQFPSYTPAQLQAFLESRTVDLGAAGKDNVYGAGRLSLGPALNVQLPSISYPSPSAIGITGSGATLVGSVNPNGAATQYRFEYGLSAAYSTATDWYALPAGQGFASVSAQISGLSPSTTYHFRLAAKNAAGTAYGIDQTFPTPAARDTTPPRVQAVTSYAVRGSVAHLQYRLWEETGATGEDINIVTSSHRVGSVHTSLGPIDSGTQYYAKWKVPASVRGPLGFCVTAYDRAGNRSAESCAKLVIR